MQLLGQVVSINKFQEISNICILLNLNGYRYFGTGSDRYRELYVLQNSLIFRLRMQCLQISNRSFNNDKQYLLIMPFAKTFIESDTRKIFYNFNLAGVRIMS